MEIDQNKAKELLAAEPPSNKKELQRFFGHTSRINAYYCDH